MPLFGTPSMLPEASVQVLGGLADINAWAFQACDGIEDILGFAVELLRNRESARGPDDQRVVAGMATAFTLRGSAAGEGANKFTWLPSEAGANELVTYVLAASPRDCRSACESYSHL